jgi:adenosine deaminase
MQQRYLIPIVFSLFIGASACDGSDTGGTAGTAGTAGTGATGDTAGTGGTAGTGDTAGTGGTAGTGATGGTAGTAGTGGKSIEEQVTEKLEAIRDDHDAVQAFVKAMPKGADLHSHTSGAVTPESMIEWGAADGACINTTTWVASPGPCMNGDVPISDALQDMALYESIVEAWSMEDFMGTLLEGHAHFFDSFGKFGGVLIDSRGDDMLAQVRSTAGKNNQIYIELMQGFGSGAVGNIAEGKFMMNDPWDKATLLQKRTEIIADPGFATAINNAKASIEFALSGSDTLLKCGTAMADPGCNVDVRLLVAGTRTRTRAYVFGQWVFALELAQTVPEVVGVNLVSPEEHPNSLLYYNDSMLAVDVLHQFNNSDPNRKPIHVGLHAGELIPEVLPMTPEGQMELDYHIRNAVALAHAERIGHGVDVLGEMADGGADDLLMDMASMGVMVEICLSSNDALLAVSGAEHPFKKYMEKGVPVALATDDQGILRIDITHEYVRAFEEQGVDYSVLKKIARTSLEHSFLAGKSLWKNLDDYTAFTDECAADTPGKAPSAGCDAFLKVNDKARIQWKHEGDVAAFEEAALK